MNDKGKKIIALLITAVCLIGVLPLSVFAAYEIVYVPPLAALTLDSRYSASNQGYVAAAGNRDALTIPLPIDKSLEVTITFGMKVTIQTEAFYVDDEYKLLHTQNVIAETTSVKLNSAYVQNASFVVLNIYQISNWDNSLFINEHPITVLEGSNTLAQHERYEQIDVPDPPTPSDGIQIQPILDMWEQLLLQNEPNLTEFYTQLLEPIGLLIGIPIMVALIGIIIFSIGGKQR